MKLIDWAPTNRFFNNDLVFHCGVQFHENQIKMMVEMLNELLKDKIVGYNITKSPAINMIGDISAYTEEEYRALKEAELDKSYCLSIAFSCVEDADYYLMIVLGEKNK